MDVRSLIRNRKKEEICKVMLKTKHATNTGLYGFISNMVRKSKLMLPIVPMHPIPRSVNLVENW